MENRVTAARGTVALVGFTVALQLERHCVDSLYCGLCSYSQEQGLCVNVSVNEV